MIVKSLCALLRQLLSRLLHYYDNVCGLHLVSRGSGDGHGVGPLRSEGQAIIEQLSLAVSSATHQQQRDQAEGGQERKSRTALHQYRQHQQHEATERCHEQRWWRLRKYPAYRYGCRVRCSSDRDIDSSA